MRDVVWSCLRGQSDPIARGSLRASIWTDAIWGRPSASAGGSHANHGSSRGIGSGGRRPRARITARAKSAAWAPPTATGPDQPLARVGSGKEARWAGPWRCSRCATHWPPILRRTARRAARRADAGPPLAPRRMWPSRGVRGAQSTQSIRGPSWSRLQAGRQVSLRATNARWQSRRRRELSTHVFGRATKTCRLSGTRRQCR